MKHLSLHQYKDFLRRFHWGIDLFMVHCISGARYLGDAGGRCGYNALTT